jgi:hypothetical protein
VYEASTLRLADTEIRGAGPGWHLMYGGSSLRRDRPRLGAHLYRQLYHRPGERPLRSLSRRHHGHPQADGERPRHHTALGRQLTSANLCGSCHNILLPVFDNAGNLLRASYVQSTHLEWTNYATLTLKGLDPAHLPAGLTQVLFVPPSPLPAVVILGSLAVLILGAGAWSVDAAMRGKSREWSGTTVPGV